MPERPIQGLMQYSEPVLWDNPVADICAFKVNDHYYNKYVTFLIWLKLMNQIRNEHRVQIPVFFACYIYSFKIWVLAKEFFYKFPVIKLCKRSVVLDKVEYHLALLLPCESPPRSTVWKTSSVQISHFGVVCVLSHFSSVWIFVTLWNVAPQAPLSMGFCRQEYWSG